MNTIKEGGVFVLHFQTFSKHGIKLSKLLDNRCSPRIFHLVGGGAAQATCTLCVVLKLVLYK
jgi:hypothetical protein